MEDHSKAGAAFRRLGLGLNEERCGCDCGCEKMLDVPATRDFPVRDDNLELWAKILSTRR